MNPIILRAHAAAHMASRPSRHRAWYRRPLALVAAAQSGWYYLLRVAFAVVKLATVFASSQVNDDDDAARLHDRRPVTSTTTEAPAPPLAGGQGRRDCHRDAPAAEH